MKYDFMMNVNFSIFLVLLLSFGSCMEVDKNPHHSGSDTITKVEILSDDQIDSTLIDYTHRYLAAFEEADYQKLSPYLYEDIFSYLKKEFEVGDTEIQRAIQSSYVDKVKELMEKAKVEKIKISFSVGEITKKISHQNCVLSKLTIYTDSEIGLDKHSLGSELIAVSTDGGSSWKFFQYDNDYSKEILKQKFPDEIVNKLLD